MTVTTRSTFAWQRAYLSENNETSLSAHLISTVLAPGGAPRRSKVTTERPQRVVERRVVYEQLVGQLTYYYLGLMPPAKPYLPTSRLSVS